MNVQVVSDQKLLNCYLSGDRNAISQLIERHSRRVRDYIQMMVKDGDVADDIFQETFIKAASSTRAAIPTTGGFSRGFCASRTTR